jgi:hypothetical protein
MEGWSRIDVQPPPEVMQHIAEKAEFPPPLPAMDFSQSDDPKKPFYRDSNAPPQGVLSFAKREDVKTPPEVPAKPAQPKPKVSPARKGKK